MEHLQPRISVRTSARPDKKTQKLSLGREQDLLSLVSGVIFLQKHTWKNVPDTDGC